MAQTSLANRVPAAILASPLHRLLSGKRLVLSFTGRRSGRRYATPINFRQRGRELLITTDSKWWRNLEGGAPVEVRLRGQRLQATAEAVRDRQLVAEALTAIVRDHRPFGRWAHIKVAADGTPNPDDVAAEVARGRVLVRVHLAGEPPRRARPPKDRDPMDARSFVLVMLAGLLTGSELTSRTIVHPVLWRLDYATQVRAEKLIYRRFASIDPVLMTATVAACFVAVGGLTGRSATLALVAGACFAGMLAITLIANKPINLRVFRWDEQHGDPEEWRRLRRRWDRLHTVRVVLDSAGFVLITLAVLGT